MEEGDNTKKHGITLSYKHFCIFDWMVPLNQGENTLTYSSGNHLERAHNKRTREMFLLRRNNNYRELKSTL